MKQLVCIYCFLIPFASPAHAHIQSEGSVDCETAVETVTFEDEMSLNDPESSLTPFADDDNRTTEAGNAVTTFHNHEQTNEDLNGSERAWPAIDEKNVVFNYDSPERKKEIILALLGLNPKMNPEELVKRSGVPTAYAISLIEELQQDKQMEWVDDNHGGFWRVTTEGFYDKQMRSKIELLRKNSYLKISEQPSDQIGLSQITSHQTHEKRQENGQSQQAESHDNRHNNDNREVLNKGTKISRSDSVREREKTILSLLTENRYMTMPQLAETLEVSLNTIKTTVKKLIEEKKLKRIGYKRNGYWRVITEKDTQTEIETEASHFDPVKEREEAILSRLAENRYMTMPQLAETLKVSLSTIKWTVRKLRRKKLLKRIGTTRSGHWEVP